MKQGFTRLTPSHRVFIPRNREDREDIREMPRPHACPYDDEKRRVMIPPLFVLTALCAKQGSMTHNHSEFSLCGQMIRLLSYHHRLGSIA